MVLSIVKGNQVPVIPLGDVSESNGAVLPLQNGGIFEKFGIVLGIIVTVNVLVVAH